MAPYPIINALSQIPPKSSKHKSLTLGETTSLAVYQKQPVDRYLKEVVRSLKEPLDLFPKIIHHFELFVTTYNDSGIVEQYQWELTIKEVRTSLSCVLDALGIINQGLFHSKCLLTQIEQFINKDQKSDAKKFGEDEVEKLTKLKQKLLKLNEFLDCVLLHYSSFSCTLPRIDEIKRAAKKIFKAINNLKPDSYINLVPNSVITEEDVLCSVLGLQDHFADRLRNLGEEKRRHQSDQYFLLRFLEDRDESHNVGNLCDVSAVECSLLKMGFTENRANLVAKWIAKQTFREHKSLLAWVQIYIENLFKYDIFLNDKVPEFPYKERKLNQWFDVPVEREEEEDGSMPKVSVINTTTVDEAKTYMKKKISDLKDENLEGELFFHGTDHKGAKNILEDGIKLGRGKPRCDFSDGGGFYVTDSFEYALDWAKIHHNTGAVLLFNISPDYRGSLKGLDLSGSTKRSDFVSVVKFFKSGEQQKNKLCRTLNNQVRKSDYILGPISRDGVKECPDAQQMCIRKEKMAEEIGKPSHLKATSVKQCAFKSLGSAAQNLDNGQIKTCDFEKVYSNSALRVTYQGDMRVISCSSKKCCRRWFITINGKECSSPAPIDAVMYSNAVNVNLHRPGTLDGLCYNIPSGPVTVGLSVGSCSGFGDIGNAATCWNSVCRFIIEEYPSLQ